VWVPANANYAITRANALSVKVKERAGNEDRSKHSLFQRGIGEDEKCLTRKL
jgi:hypothetical protein